MTSPTLDAPMLFFSFVGTVNFYLLLLTFIYWLVNPRLGIRVLILLIATETASAYLKQLLRQPRPYWLGLAHSLSTETSYGIPSSHASDSLAAWGYIALSVRKLWLWITAGSLVLLISLSRLYLGVHFPHDVLGGWLLALLVLFIFVRTEQSASAWFNARTQVTQIGIGFAASLLVVLGGWLVGRLIADVPDPANWAHFATTARSSAEYTTLAGALFGAVSGYVMMKRYAHFRTDGTWYRKAGRYLLGLVIAIVLLVGLDLLFALLAADASAIGYLLRYLRYAAVTFWGFFGAPWVFLRINLAKPVAS